MRLRGTSTSSTLTLTTSPGLDHLARVLDERSCDIAETCTRPSWCTPTSTNAPNAATLVTTPSSTMPGRRSAIFSTPSANVAVRERRARVAAGLLQLGEDVGDGRQPERVVDERPAACSGAQRRPVADQRRDVAAGRGQDPADHRVGLGVHAGRVERVVAAGDAQEAGALLERLRRPAAAPPSAPSGCGTARWRRGARRSCAASASLMPGDPAQQRHRRGVDVDADARSRSPRRPRPASGTACASARSCWYWPTPIDFGSIFTSSASGSCSRRAIETAPRSETSSSGSSAEAYADAEYTDAPASETTTLVSVSSGCRRDQLGGELVGLPGRGAVADRDQLDAVRFGAARRGWRATASHCRCGSCG